MAALLAPLSATALEDLSTVPLSKTGFFDVSQCRSLFCLFDFFDSKSIQKLSVEDIKGRTGVMSFLHDTFGNSRKLSEATQQTEEKDQKSDKHKKSADDDKSRSSKAGFCRAMLMVVKMNARLLLGYMNCFIFIHWKGGLSTSPLLGLVVSHEAMAEVSKIGNYRGGEFL